MKRLILLLVVGLSLSTSGVASAARVMSDAGLDKVTGQTGIIVNVVLDELIGGDYSQMSAQQKETVRQLIEKTFGPLTREQVDQLINSNDLFNELIQRLPEEDRARIKEAFDIITAELQTTTPADLLSLTGGGQLTGDNIENWATDKVSKILIAQQIINDMIKALPSAQYQQMMMVDQIINTHFEALKQ